MEVILRSSLGVKNGRCILHVCGGDPSWRFIHSSSFRYSPRMWRWSYHPKIGRKVLNSILHVCGGDPWAKQKSLNYFKYSPRMWRWSLHCLYDQFLHIVFSTYVEVILSLEHHSVGTLQYSPRMWRWSWHVMVLRLVRSVFSTYVEVILFEICNFFSEWCILHVCGGDPNVSSL